MVMKIRTRSMCLDFICGIQVCYVEKKKYDTPCWQKSYIFLFNIFFILHIVNSNNAYYYIPSIKNNIVAVNYTTLIKYKFKLTKIPLC